MPTTFGIAAAFFFGGKVTTTFFFGAAAFFCGEATAAGFDVGAVIPTVNVVDAATDDTDLLSETTSANECNPLVNDVGLIVKEPLVNDV